MKFSNKQKKEEYQNQLVSLQSNSTSQGWKPFQKWKKGDNWGTRFDLYQQISFTNNSVTSTRLYNPLCWSVCWTLFPFPLFRGLKRKISTRRWLSWAPRNLIVSDLAYVRKLNVPIGEKQSHRTLFLAMDHFSRY